MGFPLTWTRFVSRLGASWQTAGAVKAEIARLEVDHDSPEVLDWLAESAGVSRQQAAAVLRQMFSGIYPLPLIEAAPDKARKPACLDAVIQEMAGEGWECEIRVTTMGWRDGPGFSVWFSRWDWHGQRCASLTGGRASYHCHTSNLNEMLATAIRASDRAKRAWQDFPAVPPIQNADGGLAEQQIGATR